MKNLARDWQESRKLFFFPLDTAYNRQNSLYLLKESRTPFNFYNWVIELWAVFVSIEANNLEESSRILDI